MHGRIHVDREHQALGTDGIRAVEDRSAQSRHLHRPALVEYDHLDDRVGLLARDVERDGRSPLGVFDGGQAQRMTGFWPALRSLVMMLSLGIVFMTKSVFQSAY